MKSVTVDQALQNAKVLESQGDFTEALKLYEAILLAFPANQQAIQGAESLRKATSPDSVVAVTESWLGLYHELVQIYQGGQIQSVIERCVLATQEFSDVYQFWELLGAAAQQATQYELALTAFENAVSINRQSAVSWFNLGTACSDMGFLEKAISAYQAALKIKPAYAEALNNLGNALKDQGDLIEAIESYKQATKIKPRFQEAYFNLGRAFAANDELSLAAKSYEKALNINPRYSEALVGLGNVLRLKADYAEATEAYRRAIAINENLAEAHFNLGRVLGNLGQPESAIDALQKAVAINSESALYQYYLGDTFLNAGRQTEAIKCFKKSLTLNPKYTGVWRHVTGLSAFPVKSETVAKLQEILVSEGLTRAQRVDIGFALYNSCKRLNRTTEAFDYLREANDLKKQSLGYEFEQDAQLFTNLRSASDTWFKSGAVKGICSLIPIFIVGMPRSGTTLTEQIISSHSMVTGLGELRKVSDLLEPHLSKADVNVEGVIPALRSGYLKYVSSMLEGGSVFTDKMPHNFMWLPALAAAFPEAKFVHVYRDAAATCWSNYERFFPTDGLRYCYDLKDIVGYYNLYTHLMRQYSEALGDRIHHLDYDRLTSSAEVEITALFEYLQLDIEQGVFAPHLNSRNVATASNEQIRQPIYQGSSEKWKVFAPFTAEVFDALKPFRVT